MSDVAANNPADPQPSETRAQTRHRLERQVHNATQYLMEIDVAWAVRRAAAVAAVNEATANLLAVTQPNDD
jgi:hypothetical protein